MRDVAEMLALDAARADSPIEIEGDDAIAGEWDRTRLEQVVMNLLRNAIVFGRGKPIRVTVAASPRNAASARLVVTDSGIGIAHDEHQRIFDRFERAVSTKNYGGLGLGLYIVKQVVERHGGTIAVESEPNRGATFVVDLPMSPK